MVFWLFIRNELLNSACKQHPIHISKKKTTKPNWCFCVNLPTYLIFALNVASSIYMHTFNGGELTNLAVIDINGTIPIDSYLGQLRGWNFSVYFSICKRCGTYLDRMLGSLTVALKSSHVFTSIWGCIAHSVQSGRPHVD